MADTGGELEAKGLFCFCLVVNWMVGPQGCAVGQAVCIADCRLQSAGNRIVKVTLNA
mgnify:CR=1 FL=1